MVSIEIDPISKSSVEKNDSRSSSKDKVTSSPFTNPLKKGQNPEIKIRYSNKQLIAIFKGLGRFQSPLDYPEAYKLDI